MKKRCAMLLLSILTATSALNVGLVEESVQFQQTEYETLFNHYLQEHGKTYDAAEKAKRFGIFQANLNLIQAHNAANHTWKMGFGPFTDMTADEFYTTAVGGCYMGEGKPDSERNVEMLDVSKPFADVDWTTKTCGSGACVTPVKNQASCGSCWAFSSTGEIESRVAIKTGKLVSLSEQQLVDCSKAEGNQGCNGGLMDDAFKYVMKDGGLCTEESYPYTAKTGKECKASGCAGGLNDAITAFKDVARDNEAQLGAAIQAGPVSVAIQANKAIFQHYKSGVLSGKCCGGMIKEKCQLDHGVLLVGDVNGAWKVKNSWGPTWGDKGYIQLAKGHDKAGECGIAMQPSYIIA